MVLPHLASTGRRDALGAVVVITGAPASASALAGRAAAAAAAAHPGRAVLLADLTRRAVLGAMSPFGPRPADTLTSVLESAQVEAPAPEVLACATCVVPAGYRVLRGLAHPLDWTGVRVEAVERAIVALRSGCDLVVALVDPDLEGEAETGSIDLDDRHALARRALAHASGVAVAVEPGAAGLGLARALVGEVAATAGAPDAVALVGADGQGLGPGADGRRSPGIGALVDHALGHPRASEAPGRSPVRPGALGALEARPAPPRA